jgi:hypothetical protein
LYASYIYSPQDRIVRFAVGPCGQLTRAGGPLISPGAGSGVVMSADGRRLYGLGFTHALPDATWHLTQYDVLAGGALRAGPVIPLPVTAVPPAVVAPPDALAVSPDGRRVYVPTGYVTGYFIRQFHLDAAGELAADTPASVPWPVADGGPQPFAGSSQVSRDGRHLYVAAGPIIGQFDIAPDGRLAPMARPVVPAPGGMARSLALTPDGRSLYAAGNGGIGEFDIAADGSLHPKPVPLVDAGATRMFVAVSPDGTRVYATSAGGAGGAGGWRYAVGAGGQLSSLGVMATGDAPGDIGVAPAGDVLTGCAGGVRPVVRVLSRRLGRALVHGLLLRVSCPARCAARVRLTVGRAAARRAGLAGRTAGRRRMRLPGGAARAVRVRFERRARQRLRGLRSLRLTVTAVLTPAHAATTTVKRTVTLRR